VFIGAGVARPGVDLLYLFFKVFDFLFNQFQGFFQCSGRFQGKIEH
jgi:hypothetical protein